MTSTDPSNPPKGTSPSPAAGCTSSTGGVPATRHISSMVTASAPAPTRRSSGSWPASCTSRPATSAATAARNSRPSSASGIGGFLRKTSTLLIRGTQTPPVIGMGHSLGAVATAIAAASYPELFKALILIDPVFLPPRILWKAAGMRLLGLAGAWPRAARARKRRRVFNGKADAFRYFVARGIFKSWSPEFVQAYLECGLLEKDEQTAVLRCDPELEAQIFESVPLDVWSQCRKIRCPVLAVRGEQSDVFLKEAAVRLRAHGGRLRGRHHPGLRPFPDHGKTGAVRAGDQGLRVAAAASLRSWPAVSPPPVGCLPASRRTRRPFRRG